MVLPLLLAVVVAAPGPRDVYELRPAADAAVLAASLLAGGLPSLAKSRLVDERCPCPRDEVPGFDRVALDRSSRRAAAASDWTLALAVAVPPAADALRLGWGPALRHDLVVYAETLAVASALTQLTKVVVQRPRPRTYAGDPHYVERAEGYLSFFSGHATLTFAALSAAAMTARYRDGERVWPWVVTGVVGTSVAVERILAGEHFPSDVIAGAAVGIGTGIVVPMLHRRAAPGPRAQVLAAPVPSGAMLTIRFGG
jgi:membrane-associated phospholipid phosphatase